MNPEFLRRLDGVIEGAILFSAFLLGITWMLDTDLGWHIAAGRWMIENRTVPRADMFSLLAEGRPWIDLSWGFQLFAYACERLDGLRGLTLAKAILGFAAIFLAGRIAPRGPVRNAVMLLLLSVGWERFHLRPEALTCLLLALLVRDLTARTAGWRWVALFVVWTNVHSLFAVGLAAWFAVLAGRIVDARLGRGVAPVRKDFAQFAFSCAATLINPYGIRGSLFPIEVAARLGDRKIGTIAITELVPVWAVPHLHIYDMLFLLGCVLAVIALVRLKFPGPLSALVVVFIPLGLSAIRNEFMALLALAPVLVAGANTIRIDGVAVRGATFILLALLVSDSVSGSWFARNHDPRQIGVGFSPGVYPGRAAESVAEYGGEERIWCDMGAGGYLLWRFPNARVSLDARLEVYGEETYRTAWALDADTVAWKKEADRLGITSIVMAERWLYRNQVETLDRDTSWISVPADPAYRAWVRKM